MVYKSQILQRCVVFDSKVKAFIDLALGMIQRQALDDLDTDATYLEDVVEGQVRRLGTENRIKNATSLFGGIGEIHEGGADSSRSLDGDPSGHPDRSRVTQRSLVYMILENIVSLGKSTLSTIVMSLIAILSTIFGIISAQRILVGLLFFSVGSNLMLTSKSTMSYWAERRANRFLNEIGISPNKIMSKAVYLKDMEELISNGTELALMPNSEWYVAPNSSWITPINTMLQLFQVSRIGVTDRL